MRLVLNLFEPLLSWGCGDGQYMGPSKINISSVNLFCLLLFPQEMSFDIAKAELKSEDQHKLALAREAYEVSHQNVVIM